MDSLKGLFLLGGKGTRLRSITQASAKQLVPVPNRPALFYGIEAMAHASMTDLGSSPRFLRWPAMAPQFGIGPGSAKLKALGGHAQVASRRAGSDRRLVLRQHLMVEADPPRQGRRPLRATTGVRSGDELFAVGSDRLMRDISLTVASVQAAARAREPVC